MTFKVENILGIGPVFAKKLTAAQIFTTRDLLRHCSTADGRKMVSDITGVNEDQILAWTHLADLMRISGIGPQYAGLLANAGAPSLKELRTQDAAGLTLRLAEMNLLKRLPVPAPDEKTVQEWIDSAHFMNPVISH
jgi:hypothetical protein